MVGDDYVATQGSQIAKDQIVTKLAVVGDVSAYHQQTAGADAGGSPAFHRPAVHGHLFTEYATVAYFKQRGFASPTPILWRKAHGDERIEAAVTADSSRPQHGHLGDELGPVTDVRAFPHVA
jgi:hypothetical protein